MYINFERKNKKEKKDFYFVIYRVYIEYIIGIYRDKQKIYEILFEAICETLVYLLFILMY